MLKKICKSLGVLATAGLLLLRGVGIAEAGVLKVGTRAYPYGEILAQVQPVLAEQGVSIPQVLQNNDAYHALEKCGGLLMTGPTGTNVNDVTVLLIKR